MILDLVLVVVFAPVAILAVVLLAAAVDVWQDRRR